MAISRRDALWTRTAAAAGFALPDSRRRTRAQWPILNAFTGSARSISAT